MTYTVHELAKLSGVTPRTLRYYDEIGLLPVGRTESGYRVYGRDEVDRLQQILFYRELGLSLEDIREILPDPSFDALAALKAHREKLLGKKKRLDTLITNVDKTIAVKEGKTDMSDQEKFEGFVQQLIEDNEAKFGQEVREKYGKERVNNSYEKMWNMTREQYTVMEKLSAEVNEALVAAFEAGNPAGPLAQKACGLHRQWLMFF
jgi:DNA-binding transcriptional MerR regulator